MGNTVTIKKFAHQVTEVQVDSPGARCGLHVKDDFLIRLDGHLLMDLSAEAMHELLSRSEEKVIELQVYNSINRRLRTIMLTPSRKWPGQGLLGVSMNITEYDGYPHIKHTIESKQKQNVHEDDDSSDNPLQNSLLGKS